jgi:hypothetical protein
MINPEGRKRTSNCMIYKEDFVNETMTDKNIGIN